MLTTVSRATTADVTVAAAALTSPPAAAVLAPPSPFALATVQPAITECICICITECMCIYAMSTPAEHVRRRLPIAHRLDDDLQKLIQSMVRMIEITSSRAYLSNSQSDHRPTDE